MNDGPQSSLRQTKMLQILIPQAGAITKKNRLILLAIGFKHHAIANPRQQKLAAVHLRVLRVRADEKYLELAFY